MIDFDKVLADASLPEETVPICLDGRLVRRYEDVKARVDKRAAETADDTDMRLGADPDEDPEQADLDDLTEQVRAKTVGFVVRAMSRDAFAEYLAQPRFEARKNDAGEVDPKDSRLGLNADVFVPSLIRDSLADPAEVSDAQWARFWENLTSIQVEKLFNRSWNLNREDREVPFSPSGSPSPRS